MVVSTSISPRFIIDSGDSRHMVLTRETFSSLDDSKGPKIVLGDDSVTDSLGKGSIDLDHGSFNDVLYVPGISTDLLSAYHMTHTRSPKKFIFSPNEGSKKMISKFSHRVIFENYWWTFQHVKRIKDLPCQNHMFGSSKINGEAS